MTEEEYKANIDQLRETAVVNIKEESFKINAYGDYSKQALKDESVDQFVRVATLNQIETFHKFIVNDLFKEEKKVDFEKAWIPNREADKKYYIIPLRRVDSIESSWDSSRLEYEVDRKLLEKVERISKVGYRGMQVPIMDHIEEKKGIHDYK